MAPSVERSAPAYVQIANHYRAEITDGRLVPGDRLPSVLTIAKEWKVASATAANAIKQLRAEGYVETSSQGTVVARSKRQTTGPDRLQMLKATGSGMRENERVEILGAGLVDATDELQMLFELKDGEQVIQRRRGYYDDDGMVAISTSWLPGRFAEAAPELLRPEPLPKMTFGLIEERTGRKVVHRRDVIAIRPVPEDIADLLGVEAGTPSLTMANTYWDQAGQVTEHALDFLGTGRELSAEYQMP